MKTHNIAVIGAGQLGSRHLQGLKHAPLPMLIQVVDSNPESLRVARERYDEITPNPTATVEYLEGINALSPKLDLVIIATGSMPRVAIIQELLAKKQVANLILEKFLFPAISEYDEVERLLREKKLFENTWVNCPRRMFNGYQRLKKELAKANSIRLSVAGWNWGLGCNSVHFLDLFAMLMPPGESINNIDASTLMPRIFENKRPGYVEFAGTIHATTTAGSTAIISSLPLDNGSTPAIILTVEAEGNRYDIDEGRDTITCNGEAWSKVDLGYQSTLSGEIARQILTENRSILTPFAESAATHLALLRPMVALYNKLSGNNGDSCPIT